MTNLDSAADGGNERDPNAPALPTDAAAVEAFARRLGWRPEAEFAGAPASRRPKEYLSPEQYIAKVETEVPIMRDRLRRQDSTIVGLTTKVDETARRVNEAATVITQMHESQKTIREREYKRARADLERDMDDAARSGDPATYDQAKNKIQVLDNDHQGEVATPGQKVNGTAVDAPPAPQKIPEIEVWADDNPWFRTSVVLNQAAIEYEATLPRTIPLAERLEQTSEWVRGKFATVYPQYFPDVRIPAVETPAPPLTPPPVPRNPRRTAAPVVGQPAGGGGPADTGALTYDKLTADEKTHCDYLVRTIKGMTVKDYLDEYKR